MSEFRVSCLPLTGIICAGRPNKDGTAWAGEKHDVSDHASPSRLTHRAARQGHGVEKDGDSPSYSSAAVPFALHFFISCFSFSLLHHLQIFRSPANIPCICITCTLE